MKISHLEHFLILTDDMEGTRDFYANVLGLREGDHPDFKFPVCWMYVGDHDVVHIGEATASENQKKYLGDPTGKPGVGTGAIDHVAFRCTGLADMIAHLDGLGVEFTQRQVSDQDLYQLFLRDPNGVRVELNFPNAESEGINAPVMASDFDS